MEKSLFQYIKNLKESGWRKSQALSIHSKCFMGKPYMVYPVYFGNVFLSDFPKYKDAMKFRTMLWNNA